MIRAAWMAVLVVILGAVYLLVGRREDGAPRLSAREESALGRQAAAGVEAQYGGLDPDRAQQHRVEAIGNRLVRNSTAAATPFHFVFRVVDDASAINVEALPDGEVLITDGLINILENNAQIAGFLGHAIAHIIAHHDADALQRAHIGPDHDEAIEALMSLHYTTLQEAEADRATVAMMSDAGYDPEAYAEGLQLVEGHPHAAFFTVHPDSVNHVAQIRGAIAELRASDDVSLAH